MNRTLVGDLAEFHSAPPRQTGRTCSGRGLRRIFVTGNTVIDALKTTVRPDYRFRGQLLNTLDYTGKQVILVTCHRRENYGQPMTNIMRALRRIVKISPKWSLSIRCICPRWCRRRPGPLSGHDRIHLIEPLTPDEMHNVMARSAFVMTDSGGLQGGGPALGRPVLVLRRETERPEAVAAGTVLLAGTEEDVIYGHAARLLTDPAAYRAMAQAVNPYGDGQACRRIVDAILWKRGCGTSRRRNSPPDDGPSSGAVRKGVGCVPWTRRTGPFWSSPLR